jgi:hypothetical protein
VKQHPAKACPVKWWPPGVAHTQTEVRYIHKCYWQVQSVGWFGGATQEHPAGNKTPKAPHAICGPVSAGGIWHSDYGSAVQWSTGFSIGAAIDIKGVNLKADFSSTAHTGYDANALMDFHYKQRGLICGTNGAPADAAILVARGHS